MEFESTQKIQSQLSSGESLLWTGRPRQGILFRASDGFIIPFSLLWCGFAIFWEFSAYKSGAPAFFLLFGGAFVVIGLYFVFGRFVVDSIQRRNMYYGITDERILIHSEFPSIKTKSLSLSTLSDISIVSKPNGMGTITFGPQHPMAAMMTGMNWPGMGAYQGPSFDMIENAKSVYGTIQRAKRERGNAT